MTIGIVLIRSLMLANAIPPTHIYEFTISRMDALAVGAIAAALMRMPQTAQGLARVPGSLYLAGIALLFVTGVSTGRFSTDNPVGETVGYTLLAISVALLLLAAFCSAPKISTTPPRPVLAAVGRVLGGKLMRSVGRYSYAMYIFHLPLHVFIGAPLVSRLAPAVTPGIAACYMAMVVALCYVTAALSYHGFEKHFLRLKPAFAPRFSTRSDATGS
jgi:peptidoglycan/LPS O-acetylase OafA/YrhL